MNRLELGLHASGPRGGHLAFSGEPPSVAVDKSGTKFTLELCDMRGDIGLDGVKRSCRSAKSTVIGHR